MSADLSAAPVEHDLRPVPAAERSGRAGEPMTSAARRERPARDHPQDLSLREQARAIAAGELDATELLEATLSRIDERDSELNSIVDRFASESARMLSEAPDGPLHGVPVAVKDMFALPWRAPRDGSVRNLTGVGAGRVGGVPAAARRGRGGRRRHEHARARRGVDRPHLGLRAVRQPVGPGALRRRVVWRLGGSRRRPPGGRRGRHRRRRVDPLSRRVLRRDGPEAHLGPGAGRRIHPRVLVDERTRAAVPGRRRTRACSPRRSSGRPLERPPRAAPATRRRARLLGRRRSRRSPSSARPRSTRCARPA